jgi:gluconokinase
MIILVMGVTGSGKTTIGELVAHRLGWQFLDADDFHSAANKEKMHRGIPLTDADRWPWLDAIHAKLAELQNEKQSAVLGCSALKRIYRERLAQGIDAKIVYLKGSYNFIADRLHSRKDHFADEHILAGQFHDLEEPTNSEATVINIAPDPETIVDQIISKLALSH